MFIVVSLVTKIKVCRPIDKVMFISGQRMTNSHPFKLPHCTKIAYFYVHTANKTAIQTFSKPRVQQQKFKIERGNAWLRQKNKSYLQTSKVRLIISYSCRSTSSLGQAYYMYMLVCILELIGLGTASKPNRRLTVCSVRFRPVSIVRLGFEAAPYLSFWNFSNESNFTFPA